MRAQAVHFEVAIGAVREELGTARSEVGEPGDELLGGGSCRLVEVKGGHGVLLN
jgi:hypothetical protein